MLFRSAAKIGPAALTEIDGFLLHHGFDRCLGGREDLLQYAAVDYSYHVTIQLNPSQQIVRFYLDDGREHSWLSGSTLAEFTDLFHNLFPELALAD
jgi:hypothetical protein